MNEIIQYIPEEVRAIVVLAAVFVALVLWFVMQLKVNKSGKAITTVVKENGMILNAAVKENHEAAVIENKRLEDRIFSNDKALESILSRLEELTANVENSVVRFENSTNLQLSQPLKIKAIALSLDDIKEMQTITFELIDYFMYKNTNDKELRSLCLKFKDSKIFQTGRTLARCIKEIEANSPAIIEAINNIPNKEIEAK